MGQEPHRAGFALTGGERWQRGGYNPPYGLAGPMTIDECRLNGYLTIEYEASGERVTSDERSGILESRPA